MKTLMHTDIGRVVGLTYADAKKIVLYRIKGYDNAHRRAWLVANTQNWRESTGFTAGFDNIIFITKK